MLEGVPHPLAPEDQVPKEMLLAALEAADVTQTELARRLHLTVVSVNRWARGKTPMSRSRWIAVTAALGLPADWEPSDDSG